MADDFVTNTSDVRKGGLQGTKKLRGIIIDMTKVDAPDPTEQFPNPSSQIRVDMEDVAILEVFEGEDEYEPSEGKVSFWIPYLRKGQTKPHQNSVYARTWLDSAKALGVTDVMEFKGQYVTLEKVPTVLFTYNQTDESKQLVLDADGNKVKVEVLAVDTNGRPNRFSFAKDEGVTAEDLPQRIQEKVLGLNATAAMRAVVMDNRAQQFPEFKTLLETNPAEFATKVGLVYNAEADIFEFEEA